MSVAIAEFFAGAMLLAAMAMIGFLAWILWDKDEMFWAVVVLLAGLAGVGDVGQNVLKLVVK